MSGATRFQLSLTTNVYAFTSFVIVHIYQAAQSFCPHSSQIIDQHVYYHAHPPYAVTFSWCWW